MRLRAASLALAAGLLPAASVVRSATFTSRYAATSTLLPDGNVLVIGGQTADGAPPTLTNSVQLSLEGRDDYQDMSVTGYVDRTSHTATLLPTGEVLVAGGLSGANVALTSVQIFNPRLNCWSSSLNLSAGRFNHTATLLRDGSVLICGGNDTATTLSTCQLYQQTTPSEITCGGAPGGSLSASINMLIPRALHTATLLADGRVFFTGGVDTSGGSLNSILVTSELYSPVTNSLSAAANLITARAYHRATLMGNGKVLITGGWTNRDTAANRGYLGSVEIYDPVANTMSPGAPLLVRSQQHSSIVNGDGSVQVFGGLGNIPTTYIMVGFAGPVESGSISGCFAPADCPGNVPPAVNKLSTMAITGGSFDLDVKTQLGTQVTGIIQEGTILFSSPSITFPGGVAYLTPGQESATGVLSGTIGDLAGAAVFCKEDGTCGHIEEVLTIPTRGQYFITPDVAVTNASIATMIPTSFADWSGAIASDGTVSAPLDPASQFRGQITITGLPKPFIGHAVSSGVLHVTAGEISIPTLINISLTDGWATIPAGSVVGTDPGTGSGRLIATVTISSFNAVNGGLVTASTTTPQSGPRNVAGAALTGVAGSLKMVVDGITLSNDGSISFNVDIATVVIKRMIFSDIEKYVPATNTWEFHHRGYGSQRFGHAAVLMPNGDVRSHGGRTCLPGGCPTLVPVEDHTIIVKLSPFDSISATMGTARGNHTSTLLPDGRVLFAGGSNGPNVVATAEVFNPVLGTFSRTGDMSEPRDLHTATLLPNGRVLVAGGFTTNAVSTGAMSGAEIYYPETGVWVRTSTLPFAANNHTATLLADGNVLVAGGYSSGVYLESAAIYYSTSGTWGRLPDMPVKRALHSATLLQDGRVLFVGGLNHTGVLCTTTLYDPGAAGSPWSAGASLSIPGCTPTHSHSATLLKDGSLLVAGGNDGFGETNLSAIYTPSSGAGSWANTAVKGNELNMRRFNHSAMLLPNGIVMIAGGAQALGNSITQVETFDVSASSWQLVGSLTRPRANMTMTMLRSGLITAVGGYNGLSMESSAEQNYFTGSPDSQSLGVGPTVRQSTITRVDMQPFRENSYLTLTGLKFLGIGEAAGGGSASGNASHHNPRVVLQSIAGSGGSNSQAAAEFTLDLTTQIYAKAAGGDPNLWTKIDTSMTIQLPALLPYGWYQLRTYSNAVYADSLIVQAGPPRPPAAPGAASGTIHGVSSVTWTWSIGTGGLSLSPRNFDGYNVYSASSGIFITTVPYDRPYFTQTSLAPNTTGAIAVAAFTLTGDGPLTMSSTHYTAPTTPTFPGPSTFSAVSFNSLNLHWSANENSPGTIYEVYQSTDDFVVNITTPVPTLVNHTTTTATINFLETNTTYYFRVRAFNGAGSSSNYSVSVSTRTRAPILTLDGNALNTTTIQWNWTDPGGVNYYKVYNATSGAVIATSASSTFNDVGLATNTQRSVRISAVTDAGEGPLSPSASAYTLAAAPAGLASPYVNITTGSFSALWMANGNPLGTQYEFETMGGGGVVLDTRLTEGFNGDYGGFSQAASMFSSRVRAINGGGIPSNYTALGSSSTLARPPSDLAITGTGPSSISVSWSTNNNSSSATYEVTYTSDNFTTTHTPMPFSALLNQNAFTITGLLTSTVYQVRVQAQNIYGARTAYSNSVSTSPYNGGVAFGSLGFPVRYNENTVVTGSIGSPPRTLTFRIPPYSFPVDAFVTISTVTIPPSPCSGGTTIGVEITASPAVQPVKPLYLTLGYDPAELAGIPSDQTALMRVDGGHCVPLLTSLNSGARELTAQLNHFSQFQVARVTPSETTNSTLVFPNPFYASRGNGYVTFSQMPAGSRVRVFTMRGEVLFDQLANGSGLLTWPGTNQFGRSAASGVYLVTIESGSDKKIVKLVVLR